jgi:hypothetical protein
MKTITINVSDPVYREFQEYARRHDRTAAELIREAMDLYRQRWASRTSSLRQLPPLDLGGVRRALAADDDVLGEMLE